MGRALEATWVFSHLLIFLDQSWDSLTLEVLSNKNDSVILPSGT